MNILYIHGLESKLKPVKKEMLERYGKVFAPDLDYHSDSNAIASILEEHKGKVIDVVIGSSMGGFAGYYVSGMLNVPALLFNPALRSRSVHQEIPKEQISNLHLKQIVLGQRDEVVNPADTLGFIAENIDQKSEIFIHLRPEMHHQVPEACFEQELTSFFEKVKFTEKEK